jgi:hypothetical protein
MKEYRMVLIHPSIIIPDNPKWGAQVLGAGSVVLRVPQKPSPITGSAGDWERAEYYVQWKDVAGRLSFGWLAGTTEYKRTQHEVTRKPFFPKDALSAWDHLRSKMVGLERDEGSSARRWILRHADTHRAELISTLRQFGDTSTKAKTLSDRELAIRTLALILHRRFTMSDATKTDAAATKSAATKTAAKKTPTKKKAVAGKEIAAKVVAKKKTAKPAEEVPTRAPRGDASAYKKVLGQEAFALLKSVGIEDGQREAGLLRDGKKISTTSLGVLASACMAAKAEARASKNEKAAVKLHSLARKARGLRLALSK